MLIRNYSPAKTVFKIPHQTRDAIKDSLKFNINKRSSSQNHETTTDQMNLNKFLLNQNAQRIISPYKKTQREALSLHNLNILSLRNVNGHNQLFLSKDASPTKKRNLNTCAQTLRSELIIQATQKSQEDVVKNFSRSKTPLNQSKRNITMRSTSISNFNINKQDSFSPTKVSNSGLDSSRGMMTFSTNFQNTPKTTRSISMRRSESQGFRTSDDLNTQVQIKINEYDNLNNKIQEMMQEKQMIQIYMERIKKEIDSEKKLVQVLKDNQVKYNRENNNNIMSNNRLGEEQLYRSLEMQKQFEELKKIQSDFEEVKKCNHQILEQMENEKIQIESTRGEIYQKKKQQLEETKNKERAMKELQLQHKQMISIEKKYIDKARLQNQILHNVNKSCLPQDFLEKNNIQSDSATSKNIISLSQINEDPDNQESVMFKNDNHIPSQFKTSPKKAKKNENTLQFSLDKNQTSSYNYDFN